MTKQTQRVWVLAMLGSCFTGRGQDTSRIVDLPTSKQIIGTVPGSPQRLNSLPVSIAASSDGRWIVTVNGGYGSYESGYMQSLAVLDTRTGKVEDFPDARTLVESKQVLFSGLAFSADGKTLYASMVSGTDPKGKNGDDAGSGIAVYSFREGKIAPLRTMKIPMQQLAAGRTTRLVGGEPGSLGLPYPAAIAVLGGAASERLLVADNLSDDVLLLDSASGAVLHRFDLAEHDIVPGTYPALLAVSQDGTRAYVGLWNASEVVELDLRRAAVGRHLALLKPADPATPGSHPTALAMSPDARTLYVALGNRDAVAAIDLAAGKFALKGYLDARLPGQSFYGAEPSGVALNADGSRLYVTNMGTDAIAVFDPHKLTHAVVRKGMVEPLGFIPTEWLPLGIIATAGKLYVTTGKGVGTGPNNFAQRATEPTRAKPRMKRDFTYIGTLLHGSIAVVDAAGAERDLPQLTAQVLASNRMKAADEKIAFNPAVAKEGASPIKHVVYIIKENRTYDQVFGDLQQNGQPVGNGDPSLTMYGATVTPNLHKLALQFGVLDNFYDSAEVSGDGHVWSNAAIGTDYLERTWQLNYRGGQHGYDYEGVVSQGIPLQQKIPDVNEPSSGYLWGNLARHGKTLYHFGEFISSTFCNEKGKDGAQPDPREGPMREGKSCSVRNDVKPGQRLPEVWGGAVNKWPWAIPLLANNAPTKPELVGHYAAEAPDFNLRIPDQVRVDIFLKHLDGWLADQKAGHDTMPNFIMLRLPNDHTEGTRPGGPTPKASVADNDLAVGRAVEAIAHTPFWNDTAFFILEDDAQNGADHVDAHRSLAVVVSRYAPHGAAGRPFTDSRFYSTVSMVRTMETVLGVPPMNNNDALSSMMGTLFTGAGDQPAFSADTSNRENGLIYTANVKTAPGAKQSERMDFRHADRADAQKLNAILWRDAMGARTLPSMLTGKRKKVKHDDDDD